MAITTSFVVALIACVLVSQGDLPKYWVVFLLALIAYLLCFCLSLIYQTLKCGKIQFQGAALSNASVLGTTTITGLILLLEDIPVWKYVFGSFAPRNPLTGLPFGPETIEYKVAMTNENHYKIQFFSSIVKAVLPLYFEESVKQGFVYFYYYFWMTLLPFYFGLGILGSCS